MAWTIDTAHTTVGFKARHMGLSKVSGRFTSFRGEIEGDPTTIESAKARFEVDMASVTTGNPDRDNHLRTSDFFEVEKYPTMVFESKSVTRINDDHYKVVGDLTIKDVTREVELDYEHGGDGLDPYGNRKVGGTLIGTIKRSDWGLTWNVPLEKGGWLVSDNISLEIDLQVAEVQDAVVEEVVEEARLSA
jgi:polyisoprenoid-binding protein YceI